MLSSLLSRFHGMQQVPSQSAQSHAAFDRRSPPLRHTQQRHATADFTDLNDEDDEDEDSNDGRGGPATGYVRNEREGDGDSERGDRPSDAVLPRFSSNSLDALPVYSITHAIRAMVQKHVDTSLTWEQLRSPQISQFLIRPMEQRIRGQFLSKATLYALMANCLQFSREFHLDDGNSGSCNTRSMVCELLALTVLKDYSTRELIDILSYDFDPLQGMDGLQGRSEATPRVRFPTARSSTFELAIRASAKHFLSHPLVVQQLEAFWNGIIVFHPDEDDLNPLHRSGLQTAIGSNVSRRNSAEMAPLLSSPLPKRKPGTPLSYASPSRRRAVLYDPRSASLFRLSRLRVPRYRQILSTASLVILISLLLAVLIKRSNSITSVEIVFWFWSAGFVLDGLVGFSEQGFSLYVLSVWNMFDLGFLVLLIVYYCMRIYGVFLLDPHKWNQTAYGVLAANGILLLPTIFGAFNHHPYFSKLFIALRLIVPDFAAVMMLALITCVTFFFVFFSLSPTGTVASDMAYSTFQILMGFTPAAWDVWSSSSWFGRMFLACFLVVSQFVVLTTLIVVLTNSFLAISSSVAEEQQYLFAVRTISMVKDNALFAYIAPGNIFAWILMPLRYCLNPRGFVRLNNTLLRLSHFHLLLCIYLYERYLLARFVFEPTGLVENWGRGTRDTTGFDSMSGAVFWSPHVRLREVSAMRFQQQRALDEVFRRAPTPESERNQRGKYAKRAPIGIRSWLHQNEETLVTPASGNFVNAKDGSRPATRRRVSMNRQHARNTPRFSDARSAASDPADILLNSVFPMAADDSPNDRHEQVSVKIHTDEDGDDELATNDGRDDRTETAGNTSETRRSHESLTAAGDYISAPLTPRAEATGSVSQAWSDQRRSAATAVPARRSLHSRTMSSTTVLFNPEEDQAAHSSSSEFLLPGSQVRSRPISGKQTPTHTPTGTRPGRSSPRRSMHLASRPRPLLPPRNFAQTAPSRAALHLLRDHYPAAGRHDAQSRQRPSSAGVGSGAADETGVGKRDDDGVGVLLLARMQTLEENLADVLREMRQLRSGVYPGTGGTSETGDSGAGLAQGGGGSLPEMATISVAAGSNENDGQTQRRQSGLAGDSGAGDEVQAEGSAPLRKGKGKAVALPAEDDERVGKRRSY